MTNLNPDNAPTVKHEPLPAYITPEDRGKGISYRPEDRKTLRAAIAQTNSHAVDKNDSAFIPDANPGDIVIPDLFEAFDGEVGIDVAPFWMQRVWMGWYPGRQGYEGRYLDKPTDLVATISQEGGRPKRVFTRSSDGTVIEETLEVWMLFRGQPLQFPCRSTFITVARRWMTFAGQFRSADGEPLPLFARHYRFTTVSKSNTLGRWFVPAFQDLGYTPRDEYLMARELYDVARRGALRIDMSGEYADAT
jgi:hypothetical protein